MVSVQRLLSGVQVYKDYYQVCRCTKTTVQVCKCQQGRYEATARQRFIQHLAGNQCQIKPHTHTKQQQQKTDTTRQRIPFDNSCIASPVTTRLATRTVEESRPRQPVAGLSADSVSSTMNAHNCHDAACMASKRVTFIVPQQNGMCFIFSDSHQH